MVLHATEIPRTLFVRGIFELNIISDFRGKPHSEAFVSIITRGKVFGITQDFFLSPEYGSFAIGPGFFSENFSCAIGAGLNSLTTPETETKKTNFFYFGRIYYHDEWYKILANITLGKKEMGYSVHFLRKLAPHFYVGPTLESKGLHGLMLEYNPWKKFIFSLAGGFKAQHNWRREPIMKLSFVFRT